MLSATLRLTLRKQTIVLVWITFAIELSSSRRPCAHIGECHHKDMRECDLRGCRNGIDLSRKYLTGTIPLGMGSIRSLNLGLDLSHNDLTGTIPPSLGSLNRYLFLDLSFNSLTGSIPVSMGHLAPSVLYLHRNQLTGPIPTPWCKRPKGRAPISCTLMFWRFHAVPSCDFCIPRNCSHYVDDHGYCGVYKACPADLHPVAVAAKCLHFICDYRKTFLICLLALCTLAGIVWFLTRINFLGRYCCCDCSWLYRYKVYVHFCCWYMICCSCCRGACKQPIIKEHHSPSPEWIRFYLGVLSTPQKKKAVRATKTTALTGESEVNETVYEYAALSGDEFFSQSDSEFVQTLEEDVMRWG